MMKTPMMSQITLTFPDGNQKKFDKGITSQEVATSIAPSLAKKSYKLLRKWATL